MTIASTPTPQLREVLGRLGNTADEIAESLAAKACKGRQGSPSSCPIANYIKDQFPQSQVHVEARHSDLNGKCTSHTYAVEQFIRDFDAGRYPQLNQPSPSLGAEWK